MPRLAKKSGLRIAVEDALRKHKGSPHEHRYVIPAISDALFKKLNLPKEQLKKARKLEAHSLRLQETIAQVSHGQMITIRTARTIIENFVRDTPSFVERNPSRIPPSQRENMNILVINLKRDLEKIKNTPDHLPTTLNLGFLDNARQVHLDNLKHLLGEEKFGIYQRAMSRSQSILAKRG